MLRVYGCEYILISVVVSWRRYILETTVAILYIDKMQIVRKFKK